MESGEKSTGTGMRIIKRAISVAWKVAIVAAIAGFAVYRLRFAPISVDSRPAATGAIIAEVMGTGTLESRVLATISPKISGLVTQLLVDQGDRITKGQPLATLDDRDLRQQVEMGKAEVAATRAGVDRAVADIAIAEATAVQARASYQRNVQLASQKFLSADDFDKATQQRDVTEAQLTRSKLVKVELERQVVKAQETLRYYQERLADTKIVSPFEGLVVRRSHEPGDVVVPGSEILQIISTEQMWVSAWVDETAMASVAAGQPVRIVFRSDPETPYSGAVTRLAPLADRETREFRVDVTVKELPKTWAVGQRAEVYIQTAKMDPALLAPAAAIVWQKGKPGLFVSDGGHARWRDVALGLRGTNSVEVIKGLNAGELVVWLHDPKDGSLTEGRAVAPVSAP